MKEVSQVNTAIGIYSLKDNLLNNKIISMRDIKMMKCFLLLALIMIHYKIDLEVVKETYKEVDQDLNTLTPITKVEVLIVQTIQEMSNQLSLYSTNVHLYQELDKERIVSQIFNMLEDLVLQNQNIHKRHMKNQ